VLLTETQFLERIEDFFIGRSRGVLHVGAHFGQEADRYSRLGVKVLWVEALPRTYEILLQNISRYSNQHGLLLLLGDEDRSEVTFNVASNNGASSSIYTFGDALGFDDLQMTQILNLKMHRLDSVFEFEELAGYSHWVLDVQGAELLVLKGAGELFNHCKSLLIEVSTREVYKHGAKWSEIKNYLMAKNLSPIYEPMQGDHCNILFIRNS
jgi:FkbM family methyltransferase